MALGHSRDRLPRPTASERERVHEPRVTEQVHNLATPSLRGGAVDEQRVLDATVDGFRVGTEYTEPGEVRRRLGDGDLTDSAPS